MKVLRIAICLFLCLSFAHAHAQQSKEIRYSPLRKIIPDRNLPEGVKAMRANNNMDLIQFEGRYYLAFRTAPTHFASKRTKLYVLSSPDMNEWRLEKEVDLDSDIREPRFLNFEEKLFLYFFQGGGSPFRFQPQHVWVCTLDSAKTWNMNQLTALDGFVPWRVKNHNGIAYLSAYYGKDLYQASHQGDLRLFTSSNGFDWKPIGERSQVSVPGAEEGEFEFDKAGNLWGTVRLEGKGAFIAYADKDSLQNWQLFPCKDKYDSALLFSHEDDMYLIARRNHDGSNFAKAPVWMPYNYEQKYNLISYWFSKKVTALFKLDKEKKEMAHVMDFPSTGDNSFPGLVGTSDSTYYMINYSSDIDGERKTWVRGQLGRTYIYLTELMFSNSAKGEESPGG